MKINTAQLTSHLQKSLAGFYLISSSEMLLVDETVNAICETAKKSGFSERVSIPGDSDWEKHLYSDAHNISLFSEKKIIDLHLNTSKLSAAHGKILEAYAANPKPDTVVIVRSAKIDGTIEKTQWYKSLEKKAIVVVAWPITSEQLPNWIIERAKKYQLTITKNAAEWLALQMEGHLFAIAQEIEKFALLKCNETIDLDMLQTIVTDNARFDIFQLVDSTLAGKTERSLRILKNLAAEDTEPTLILWALSRELRTLAEMHRKMKEGATLTSLFASFRVWEKRQALIKSNLSRHSIQSYWDLLIHAAKIDRIIKGAEMGQVWEEFARLVLNIGKPASEPQP